MSDDRTQSIRVLLLEDSPLDAELVAARLEQDGVAHAITRVEDRVGFLHAIADGSFDLILSDYHVPSFDGHQALDLARTHAPQLPFLFVSGAIGEDIAIESLQRGATDYVLKHRLERLTPAVRRALREREEREARRRAEIERDELLRAEQQARLAAERAAREQRLLARIGEILGSSLRLEETLPRLATVASRELADACAIRLDEREAARAGSAEGLGRLAEPDLAAAVAAMQPFEAERDVVRPIVVRGRAAGALAIAGARCEPWMIEELARRIATSAELAALHADAERARAAAEDASRTKDEFLAALSHELRTPLNAILGWAKILRTGRLDPERHERAIEVIERNARAQTQLIDDLLDVSRIVSGKLRVEPVDVEIQSLAELALEGARPQADAKGVALRAEIAPEPTLVRGDPDRLQQVLWNLLTNAVKFTPAGGSITLRCVAEGGSVALSVEDTGSGIDRAFLPHVFERYRQAEGGSTRQHGGLGLGLAIARHIVELHGGTIEAHSAGRGCGARFTVRLATVGASSARPHVLAVARPSLAPNLRPTPRLDGACVLVVDDEPDARELLAEVLRELGADVVLADSVASALEATRARQPAVIVSDLGMPGRDGFELARDLRTRHGTPLIALSAYSAAEDRARALEAGFARHLAKPVEPTELALAIADVLSARAG